MHAKHADGPVRFKDIGHACIYFAKGTPKVLSTPRICVFRVHQRKSAFKLSFLIEDPQLRTSLHSNVVRIVIVIMIPIPANQVGTVQVARWRPRPHARGPLGERFTRRSKCRLQYCPVFFLD
jgi:hypothetical protein